MGRLYRQAPRPANFHGKPISAEMARALEALSQGSMDKWRRGYARDMAGPFFHEGTIDSLWKRGLVDYTGIVKRAYITREGLAALAAWREQSNKTEAA